MVPAPPLPPRAWLVVALLWVVGCLNYLDRVIITTMRGSVVEAIPMTDAQFGLLRFPAGLSALSSAAGVAAGVGIAATGLGEAMGAMGAASTGERMVSGDIEIATGGGDGRAERGGGTAK